MCILLITRKTSFERSYNYGIHAQRHFPPLSLERLQLLVDTGQGLGPVFRFRIRIGSGFNKVSGSVTGSEFGIRIRIQEVKNDPQ
jgi:hypothetical protein